MTTGQAVTDGALSADGTNVEPDYSSGQRLLALLCTFFFPFISLFAALIIRSGESSAVRRRTLRTWAIGSAVWLAAGLVVVIGVVASVGSVSHSPGVVKVNSNGPCMGGPVLGAAGTPVGNGNFRFACSDGGSTIMHFGN